MTCPLCSLPLLYKAPTNNGLAFKMCPAKETILADDMDHRKYEMNHYFVYMTLSFPQKDEQNIYIYPYRLIIYEDHTSIYSYTKDNRGILILNITNKLDILPQRKMLNKIETIVLFS